MNCKNCFGQIEENMIRCNSCNSPLHRDCAINDGGTFYCDVCYTTKQEGGEREDIQIPSVIRRSYIETYRVCPYKFYMEVIKGIESPYTIYTKLGVDLHELFDKACKDNSYGISSMTREFNKMWKDYDPLLFESEEQKEKMYKRGIDSINTFYHVLKDLPKKPYSTEETIQFSIGEGLPLVQATSDRIDLIDGELEIIDWKTGTVMVGIKLSTDLQAPLYIYSVRQKYNLPVRKFTLHYLQENKQRVFERITNEDYVCTVGKRKYKINLTDAIREVKSIFSQIKKGRFNIPRDTRKMYFTCKMCHLRKQEICKGADLESWSQYNRRRE